MTEPLRRTMNHTSGECKPVLAGFGFSVLVRLTPPTELQINPCILMV